MGQLIFDKETESFFQKTQKQLTKYIALERDVKQLNAFPITKKQCLYIINWKLRKCTFKKGVLNFLGYRNEDYTFDFALHNYHPNDVQLVRRIIRAGVEHCIQNDVSQDDFLLFLTYRIKKNNGSYVKVMRQSSMFEVDDKGRMISNLSLLTDISFLDKTERVNWTIQGNNLHEEAFKQKVYEVFDDFFTPREKDIIQLMADNKTNNEIADVLYISKHIVATHRKNIFRKSNCNSLEMLLDFAHECGVLV